MIGVKLPKTKVDWEAANIFFKINMPATSLGMIPNVHEFALKLQETIYEYFARTEGLVIKEKSELYTNKYTNFTTKQLKQELLTLKLNNILHVFQNFLCRFDFVAVLV